MVSGRVSSRGAGESAIVDGIATTITYLGFLDHDILDYADNMRVSRSRLYSQTTTQSIPSVISRSGYIKHHIHVIQWPGSVT